MPLDFDGHLSVASGKVAGSLTATVSRDVTVAGGALTLHAGSTFTLDSEAGLTVQAAASIGGVEVTLAGDGGGCPRLDRCRDLDRHAVAGAPAPGCRSRPTSPAA